MPDLLQEPLTVDIVADTTRFDAAMRRLTEAMVKFVQTISPHLPAIEKALRQHEAGQRRMRQQLRYREQRAARRARRASRAEAGCQCDECVLTDAPTEAGLRPSDNDREG